MQRSVHRPLFIRLLTPRRSRRAPEPVGACAVCGVAFAASDERRTDVLEVLRVHERICPGGIRTGHVVEPFP